MVMAYGNPMALNQLATINVPEPRLITVQVWDRSQVGAVDRAAWAEYSRAAALRGLGETRTALDVIQNALRLAEGTGDRRFVDGGRPFAL